MKLTDYKKSLIMLTSFGVLLTTNLVSPVFAETEIKAKSAGLFCNNVETLTSKILEKINQRDTKIESIRAERLSKQAAKRSEKDQKISTNRTEWDGNRAQHYTKLEEKATTDAQKQAVATFKSTVENAVVVRKTAVDSAISTYRTAVDQEIAGKFSTNGGAIDTFIAAVNAAASKAKSDCAGGVESPTVRTTLRDSIKAARESLKASVIAKGTLKTSIEQLNATKRQSIEKAVSDFKVTVEGARTNLKASFAK